MQHPWHMELENMTAMGRVGPRSVRLWVRSRKPGRLAVRIRQAGEEKPVLETRAEIPPDNPADNTCCIRIPPGERPPEDSPLAPLTAYRYEVVHAGDGEEVGRGRFETFPAHPAETPSRFAVAVFSCHQPFDKNGYVRTSAEQMLSAARQALEAHNTKALFMAGDQMYTDYPAPFSLFRPDYFARVAPPGRAGIQDCTAAEVRRLLHQRYRQFWSLPQWQELQAAFPCFPTWDDHDIVDNWGSDPAHQDAGWHAFFQGARQACFDYQVSRALETRGEMPPDFHYSLCYGHSAFFVADLRSDRRAGRGGRLLSPRQKAQFVDFLKGTRHQKALFIVLSVPVVHLPRMLARLVSKLPPSNEDFSDRWSSGAQIKDREWFLKTLHDHQTRHPAQRVVLLSGDIHIGCVHRIRWDKGGMPLFQVISSAITHETGPLISTGSKLLIHANRRVLTRDGQLGADVRLLKGVRGKTRNPFGGLNLGIVEIDTRPETGAAGLRFHLYGHRKGNPVCVYRSPWV